MTIRTLIKAAEKLAVDNSPTLFSAVAVTGTITTAFLTGKATFKAAEIIESEMIHQDMQELGHVLTTKEKIKLVWPQYIPPAIAVVGTVACIVTANSISASRMAGLAAAYKLSEKQYKEYEDKIKEKLGLKEAEEIRHEINQDEIDRTYREVHGDSVGLGRPSLGVGGNTLFYEKWTGRYFWSDMETVKGAMNTLNYRMMTDHYATLSDFYDEIGLKNTQFSGEMGWSIENPVELYFDATMADGGKIPCIVMEYHNRPDTIKNYNYHGIH
jgi:hypothetical protein